MEMVAETVSKLEGLNMTSVTQDLDAMPKAKLLGLFDALESMRLTLEQVQAAVEKEIGYREWEGVAA